MDVVVSIIISVMSGFIASIITLIVFSFVKPKIKISENISCAIKDDAYIFQIKFINLTKCSIKNVDYSLALINEKNDNGIKTKEMNNVSLKKEKLRTIKKVSKFNTDYAIRISSKGNLSEILNDAKKHFNKKNEKVYFEFSVYAEHALTSAGKLFVKEFDINSFKIGEFESGKALAVKEIKYSDREKRNAVKVKSQESFEDILHLNKV